MKNRIKDMNFILRFKDLLIEALRDNKKLIIGLYILFIICFVAAWFLSASKVQMAFANIPLGNGTDISISALELFIHNASGGIMIYLSSILFAIPAIVMIIYDGINIAVIGQLISTVTHNDGMFYFVYLIPHGIFEITASVIQSACGVMLFRFICRFIKAIHNSEIHGTSEAFNSSKKILIQSIVLMVFSIILLLIAAPIEAYVSVPVAEFLTGV